MSSSDTNQAIEGGTSFEPFDAAANVPGGMVNSSDHNQTSTDNVIPAQQIRQGWNKTLAGLNKAWTSTRTATGNFVKEKKLDKSWEQAKTKTAATTRKAGESMNKVAKDLELEKKWKATVDKSAAIAVKVREQTEQLIGGKNNNETASTSEFDIPPSSAPIIYNDLGDGTAGVSKNNEDIQYSAKPEQIVRNKGSSTDQLKSPMENTALSSNQHKAVEKKDENADIDTAAEFSIDDGDEDSSNKVNATVI